MLLNCGAGETLEHLLDNKEIKPVDPKGNQPWILEGSMLKLKLILWLSDTKSRLTGKDPVAEKDWRLEKGMTEDDGWMASLTQWTWVWASSRRWWRTGKPGVLQSMMSESDMTERLKNNFTISPLCFPHLKVLFVPLKFIYWSPNSSMWHLEVGPSGGNRIMRVESSWKGLVALEEAHKRDNPSLPPSLCHIRTQWEGSCWEAKK